MEPAPLLRRAVTGPVPSIFWRLFDGGAIFFKLQFHHHNWTLAAVEGALFGARRCRLFASSRFSLLTVMALHPVLCSEVLVYNVVVALVQVTGVGDHLLVPTLRSPIDRCVPTLASITPALRPGLLPLLGLALALVLLRQDCLYGPDIPGFLPASSRVLYCGRLECDRQPSCTPQAYWKENLLSLCIVIPEVGCWSEATGFSLPRIKDHATLTIVYCGELLEPFLLPFLRGFHHRHLAGRLRWRKRSQWSVLLLALACCHNDRRGLTLFLLFQVIRNV
mmetsp:Transcript_33579/g.49134  ORF Transcript_33579/g.49134 Transcript_33579/m.49134 type:complete len:278 (-) Transcript_33579:77-910(-)